MQLGYSPGIKTIYYGGGEICNFINLKASKTEKEEEEIASLYSSGAPPKGAIQMGHQDKADPQNASRELRQTHHAVCGPFLPPWKEVT